MSSCWDLWVKLLRQVFVDNYTLTLRWQVPQLMIFSRFSCTVIISESGSSIIDVGVQSQRWTAGCNSAVASLRIAGILSPSSALPVYQWLYITCEKWFGAQRNSNSVQVLISCRLQLQSSVACLGSEHLNVSVSLQKLWNYCRVHRRVMASRAEYWSWKPRTS